MSDGTTTPQQVGCSVTSLLLHVAVCAGAYLGWRVGRPHGLGFGLLGGALGFVLAVPAFGILLLPVLGLACLVERITTGRWPDSSPPSGPPRE